MATPFGSTRQNDAPFARELAIRQNELSARELSTFSISNLGSLALRRTILLGIPGSGKTSLASALKDLDPGINYISLGDISRNLPSDSLLRQELNEVFAAGAPVGDPDLFLRIIEPYVDEALRGSGGFIIDGIPKKAAEMPPLLDFLDSKNASPELIISCEASPLEAHRRTIARSSRPGDPDTMDIFLNRTKVYLRDLDTFKKNLAADRGTPLITVNTECASPQSLARAIDLVANPAKNLELMSDRPEAHTSIRLYEAIRSGNYEDAFNLYGSLFDDRLPSINHGKVMSPEFKEHRQAYIEMALSVEHPELRDTPKFLRRLASNYINTTLTSINHLLESLSEEVRLRHGDDFSLENVADILEQQIELKHLIDNLQNALVNGQSLESLTDREIAANSHELDHISKVMRERATALGLDEIETSAHELMRLQPRLWGQLTSNQVLMTPDLNYRSTSNGLPDAHHSLLPFTHNPRALSANSMGNYIPFIEAVSATENTYSSTFGFIHFIGMDQSGEAFGVEYPIMMHDRRLLNLESATINSVLTACNAFYSNHDIWHNLLPVYSKSFILHHPDAPISYGGRASAYLEYGNGLRHEKEEYEIGVAMAHAQTQAERFDQDPVLEEQQAELLLSSLRSLKNLPDELAPRPEITAEEIVIIVDYLACMLATRAYNVFPDGHPIYSDIEPLLHSLKVAPLTVTAADVASLLITQGLIKLPDSDPDGRTLQNAVTSDPLVAQDVIKNHIALENPGRESGAEHIVEALRRWGIMSELGKSAETVIGPLEKSRWLAMIAPQRQQLKGHMEKVHGKPGYMFAGKLLSDPRDLTLIQKKALDADWPEYEYRVQARTANQRLSYKIYSLLFDDDQQAQRIARQQLANLKASNDTGQRLFTKEAIEAMDDMLHSLVTSEYRIKNPSIDYLESYATSLHIKETAKELQISLQSIVIEYRRLAEQEAVHQDKLGIQYSVATQQINDEHMDIA